MTLRNRLTLIFTALVAFLLAIFGFGIYWQSENYRQDEFRSRLRDKAATTAKLLIEVDEVDEKLLKTLDRNNLTSMVREHVTVYLPDGKLLYDSDEKDGDKHGLTQAEREYILSGQELFYTKDVIEGIGNKVIYRGNEYITFASAHDKFGMQKMVNLRRSLFAGWVFSLVIIFLLGRFLAGRATSPLAGILKQIDHIEPDSLDQRLDPPQSGDELQGLVEKFNRMLDRLSQAFRFQRQFLDQAAHELRTPLTSIKGQIAVELIKDRSVQEYKEALKSIGEDIDNLTLLVNTLIDLSLASQDAATLSMERLELDELVFEAYDIVRSRHPDLEVDLELPEEGLTFSLTGNKPLMRSAIMNLFDNAAKYSIDGSVLVKLLEGEGRIELVFANPVKVAPSDNPKRWLDSFVRGQMTRTTRGLGLGLALVSRIIEVHHAEIDLHVQDDLFVMRLIFRAV